MATAPFVLGRGTGSNPWRETLPYFGTRNRKNLVVEEGTTSPENVQLAMDLPAWKNPTKWIFHNLGNLLRPLESIPATRERCVSDRVASSDNTWRLNIQGKGNHNSSATISSTCVDE